MIPSKVSAKLSLNLDTSEVHEMIIHCYEQVYSPKLTLHELTAELEALIQTEAISKKDQLLSGIDTYGLSPREISFHAIIHEVHNLPGIIAVAGDVFTLTAEIIFEDFIILGKTNGFFLVTHETDDFYDKMVDIHYLPESSDVKFLKMQRL